MAIGVSSVYRSMVSGGYRVGIIVELLECKHYATAVPILELRYNDYSRSFAIVGNPSEGRSVHGSERQ
jgi:hypothetical protein